MVMRTQTTKQDSNELNTSAIRDAMPYGSRRTANIDAQNAIGAVTHIMLGPSHMSGCPQVNLKERPTPISGIPLRTSAMIPDIVTSSAPTKKRNSRTHLFVTHSLNRLLIE